MEIMENLKRGFEKIERAMMDVAEMIEDNEALKDYLIETCNWDEDYAPEMNVAEMFVKYLTQGRSL